MALIKIKQVDDLGNQLTNLGTSITDVQSNAISTAASLDVVLEGELQTYAASLDTVLEGELQTYAASLDTVLETGLSADIVAAESDAIVAAVSHADSLDVIMDGRVTDLEAAIMEDFDQITIRSTFGSLATLDEITSVDNGTNNDTLTIVLAGGKAIQNPDGTNAKPGDLVDVYINGVHAPINVGDTTTTSIQTVSVGFEIDNDDVITIKYQVESRAGL